MSEDPENLDTLVETLAQQMFQVRGHVIDAQSPARERRVELEDESKNLRDRLSDIAREKREIDDLEETCKKRLTDIAKQRAELEQLPYLALADAFHHRLYESPAAGTSDFDGMWAKLVEIFQPGIDFSGHERARGLRWRLGDFFSQPFYAIEYAVAEIAAIQFLESYEQDPRDGFERYITFCRIAGSRPLVEALASITAMAQRGSV